MLFPEELYHTEQQYQKAKIIVENGNYDAAKEFAIQGILLEICLADYFDNVGIIYKHTQNFEHKDFIIEDIQYDIKSGSSKTITISNDLRLWLKENLDVHIIAYEYFKEEKVFRFIVEVNGRFLTADDDFRLIESIEERKKYNRGEQKREPSWFQRIDYLRKDGKILEK